MVVPLMHTVHLRLQRYFGAAVGKGRQAAKTEIERLKLGELTCRQGVMEVAKM
jgi:20S proteasome subunit alpha 7